MLIKKRNKKPLLENITITDIWSVEKSIAKYNGKIIFVHYGISGDIVDIQITKKTQTILWRIYQKFSFLFKT